MKKSLRETFSERLRELRADKKQAEIAPIFGVKAVAYGNWERGEKLPDIITLGEIAQYYGVSADWLLGLSDKEPARQTPAPDAASGSSDAYWRDLAISQQDTIARLTALLAEGRATRAAPASTGGRAVTKPA